MANPNPLLNYDEDTPYKGRVDLQKAVITGNLKDVLKYKDVLSSDQKSKVKSDFDKLHPQVWDAYRTVKKIPWVANKIQPPSGKDPELYQLTKEYQESKRANPLKVMTSPTTYVKNIAESGANIFRDYPEFQSEEDKKHWYGPIKGVGKEILAGAGKAFNFVEDVLPPVRMAMQGVMSVPHIAAESYHGVKNLFNKPSDQLTPEENEARIKELMDEGGDASAMKVFLRSALEKPVEAGEIFNKSTIEEHPTATGLTALAANFVPIGGITNKIGKKMGLIKDPAKIKAAEDLKELIQVEHAAKDTGNTISTFQHPVKEQYGLFNKVDDLEDIHNFKIGEPLQKSDIQLIKSKIQQPYIPVPKPVAIETAKDMEVLSPNVKDIVSFTGTSGKTLQRFADTVFKKNPKAKKLFQEQYINGFENAKNAMNTTILNGQTIGKKFFKILGIKQGSKESKAVIDYRLAKDKDVAFMDLVKDFGKEKADNIVKADGFLDDFYKGALEKINLARVQRGVDPIKGVENYARDLRVNDDYSKLLSGKLDDVLSTTPNLKNKEKSLSITQHKEKTLGDTDAISGYYNYVPQLAHELHAQPWSSKFRSLANEMRAAGKTKNAKYLDDMSDIILGQINKKTGGLVDPLAKGLEFVMHRGAANTLSQLSSAVHQLASHVNGYAVSGKHYPQGMLDALKQALGKKNNVPPIWESEFMNARELFQKVGGIDKNVLKRGTIGNLVDTVYQKATGVNKGPSKATQLEGWLTKHGYDLMSASEKTASASTWNALYRKAEALGKNKKQAIEFADEWAKRALGARGTFEMPPLYYKKYVRLLTPFIYESANTMHLLKDLATTKDFKALDKIGAIARYVMAAKLYNMGMEKIGGGGTIFDPAGDAYKAIKEAMSDDTISQKSYKVPGRLIGSAVGSIPFGNTAINLYNSTLKAGKLDLPTSKDILGDEDPTRYGSSMFLQNIIAHPFKSFLPPTGGLQAKKIYDTIKAVEKGGVYNKKGNKKISIESDAGNIMRGIFGGKYNFREMQEFFRKKDLKENKAKSKKQKKANPLSGE